jgi:hypothetical protein
MAARWQHKPATAAADAGHRGRGDTLEAALATGGRSSLTPNPVVREATWCNPAIEAVADDLARPTRILFTEMLAVGLRDYLNRRDHDFSGAAASLEPGRKSCNSASFRGGIAAAGWPQIPGFWSEMEAGASPNRRTSVGRGR